jgi:hypothetical protein
MPAVMAAGAVSALGLVYVVWRRGRNRIEYELGEDGLLLRRGGMEERLPFTEVMDVNLVDLFTARDYLKQRSAKDVQGDGARSVRTAYCWAKGILPRWYGVSDLSLRNAGRSLVLLRTRDGSTWLLSPKHGSSMVAAMGRALERPSDPMVTAA